MAQNNTSTVKESPREKAERLTAQAKEQIDAAVSSAIRDSSFYGAVVAKIQFVGGVPEFVAVTNERTFK